MQKEIWEKEYSKDKNLPSSTTLFPSKTLKNFLENNKVVKGDALDIGSGIGRNSIYLAQQGFKNIIGIEISEAAIKKARQNVKALKLQDKIKFINASAGKTLPFEDSSFDLVVDMMVLHLLDKEERETYVKEILRVLRPNGYYVLQTLDAESPSAQALFKKQPGPEKDSYIIKESGAIEKCFSIKDLTIIFSKLDTIRLESKTSNTAAFNGVFERSYISGVFAKT